MADHEDEITFYDEEGNVVYSSFDEACRDLGLKDWATCMPTTSQTLPLNIGKLRELAAVETAALMWGQAEVYSEPEGAGGLHSSKPQDTTNSQLRVLRGGGG
ncbi:MAG: hypothetical protein ACYDHY_06830 [Acidiferrobacterales bacterium]